MREIKFRAWDKEQKLMEYENYKLSDITCIGNWRIVERLAWMQYTGLHDKNGREIYFGDILQTSSDDPETDMWKAEDWGLTVCVEREGRLGVSFTDWHPTEDEESVFNWKYVEVIGNIYENQELIR